MINFDYNLCSENLVKATTITDLGLLLHSIFHLDLRFDEITAEAYQTYNFEMRYLYSHLYTLYAQ